MQAHVGRSDITRGGILHFLEAGLARCQSHIISIDMSTKATFLAS